MDAFNLKLIQTRQHRIAATVRECRNEHTRRRRLPIRAASLGLLGGVALTLLSTLGCGDGTPVPVCDGYDNDCDGEIEEAMLCDEP